MCLIPQGLLYFFLSLHSNWAAVSHSNGKLNTQIVHSFKLIPLVNSSLCSLWLSALMGIVNIIKIVLHEFTTVDNADHEIMQCIIAIVVLVKSDFHVFLLSCDT